MKYLSKQLEYISPIPTQGIFKNAWVESGKKVIDDTIGQELFKIDFHLKYLRDNLPVTLETVTVMFGIKEDTIITNDLGEEQEIIEALTAGWQYDKTKVKTWGRPSFYGVQQYFDVTTIWGDLKLNSAHPLYFQIAKDWIDANIMIQGVPIGINFELEVIT